MVEVTTTGFKFCSNHPSICDYEIDVDPNLYELNNNLYELKNMNPKNPATNSTILTFSPKLKEAMAEIKAIITKYDIAAHVLLQEPGFSEYLLAIDPSWSLLKFEKNGIRIRSKLEDFAGDKNAQHQASENTASLIRLFADVLARDAGIFEDLHKILLKHWDITHTAGIHTRHRDN